MYYMYYPLITCFVDKKHVFSIVPNANYIQNTALFQISFFSRHLVLWQIFFNKCF